RSAAPSRVRGKCANDRRSRRQSRQRGRRRRATSSAASTRRAWRWPTCPASCRTGSRRGASTVRVCAPREGATPCRTARRGRGAFVGMQRALNVILRQDGDEITVEIGAGQWLDKAAAGVVSLFILWPLAVTAAIGAWNQMKMPERIFTRVNDYVKKKQERPLPAPAPPAGGLSPERIAQLRELAALRDQGVLTDEEFQAEKARLLGS